MESKMQTAKKMLVLVLAFLIAFTYMPFGMGTGTADATSVVSGTFKEGRVLESASGDTFKYTGSDAGWMQVYFISYAGGGFKVGPVREVSPIRAYRVNGDVAYCLEHGVMADESVNMRGIERKKSYLEDVYDSKNLGYILNNMSLCLLYGRQSGRSMNVLYDKLGFKDSKYFGRNASTYNLDDWEVATRQLIHESQQRFRDEKFNKLSSNGLYFENGWYQGVTDAGNGNGKKIPQSHYRKPLEGTGAVDIYDYMATLIKDHLQLSEKMGSKNDSKPKEISLTKADDGKWYSNKIAITKREAIAVKMVKDNGDEYKNYHINLIEEGGKYYYQYCMDSEPNWNKTYTVKKKIDYFKNVPDDMLIFECKDGRGGHVQALATGSADPIGRYVKFTTKETPPEPVTDEEPQSPEYFPSIQINVDKKDLNPGFDGDNKTPMGDATLAATYVLLRDGVEVDRITLDEYGSVGTLSDIPWTDESVLTKSESGQTQVHLVETSPEEPPTDHCGTEGPTRYDWDGSVTYTVKEIRPDGRFVEPDTGVRSMTVTYNAYTEDMRNYACESKNWSDMVYTIKTTEDNGITLNTETGTIDAVSDIVTSDADTFINDCYRGKLTLSKSLENSDVFSERKSGTVGGEKDSTKSLWKLRLNSGGYENHPYVRFTREADLADGTAVYRVARDNSGESCETAEMKIGTNGDLLVLDIPYGEYTMSEVSADDISYVKEHFKVVIDEHNKTYDATGRNDNRYDYNVRDKKITNVIKVIKTNAETGKQVRAAGTKFYIRYMGDPLLADPTSAKNYGRLLPNAEDITKDGPYTWEADENGEITIPYELEWGTYRLEEWLLPEGYFVGEYEDGTAKNHDYGKVEEEQQKALLGHEYSDLVGIYDETGEKVSYKDKDSYKINEVFNFYTFTVEKQEDHVDGNFAQKVTADGDITAADDKYNAGDYPYTNYYKAVAMANNMVKGKIEVNKEGEVLSGFKEEVKEGKTVFTPIYAAYEKLKGVVYKIYAAIDTWLNDGTDGPDIYDNSTGEKLTIPKTKSTNEGNLLESITSALSKFFKGTRSVYETGEMLHNSGAKLWYLKDREAKEDGRYTRVYVSPEQKDTKYSYSYEKEEGGFKYRYDVEVGMNYQAGGNSVTDVKVTKVTSVKDGYSLTIPETKPAGSVGEVTLDPIENFLAKTDETLVAKASSLSVTEKSYTYELMGGEGTDINGEECDENGNFKKMLVQSFDAKYEQVAGDDTGFTFTWDGFTVNSKASSADKNVVTKITKQANSISPAAEIGAGYTYEEAGREMTFTGHEPASPIYFLTKDGVRTEMFYAGGMMKTIITLPQSAVDKDFSYIVPTLNFVEEGKDNIIDWYSALSADKPVSEGSPIPGVSWKAERIESGETGEAESYRIEILSNSNSENPMEITFSDGYTMRMFADTAESGNGVGVIVLDNVYKTNRASLGELVDTIITDDNGKAVSKLLPLGKYIVREVSAPNGYVTDGKGYEVELSYKDQFTPVIWKNLNLKNSYFTVEIDLEKVFETAFESGEYTPGSGAAFGIYNTNDIPAGEKTLKAGSLMDVVKVDDSGKALSKIKLPMGTYYIKELATKTGYVLNDTPFYFVVGDSKEIASDTCVFGEGNADGVSGRVTMNGFNTAKIVIDTKVRYPMPNITIGGIEYGLNADLVDKNIKITADKDISKVEITVTEEKEETVILPNGKTLSVKVNGNTFECTYDGVTTTYIPRVSYTGYYGKYELGFTPVKGESLDTITDRIVLTEAGYSISSDRLTAEITRTPVTKEVTEGEVTKTIGVLDKDGNQSYTHSAVVRFVSALGECVIDGEITRTRGGVTTTEALSDTKEIEVLTGDTVSFKTTSGVNACVMLDKGGMIKCYVNNGVMGSLSDEERMTASVNGVDKSSDIVFAKSVTLARQDSNSDTLKIKINTLDNLNASPIKNDKVEPEKPSNPPSKTDKTPQIRTVANDSYTQGHIGFAGKDAGIKDTVFFYNLKVGEKYILRGTLMDKETGKALIIGGKEVTSEKEFTPTVTTGTEVMEFTFDARDLLGKDVVVFEKLYKVTGEGETLVTTHEDIKDEGQTVSYERPPADEPKQEDPIEPEEEEPKKPEKKVPKTGDTANAYPWIILMIGSGLGFACLRKKEEQE